MLNLKLEQGEVLHVGDAEIRILGREGKHYTIGVTAPREIKVLRGRLVERERAAAAATGPLETGPGK